MAINHFPFAQATFLANAGLAGQGGVCLELCRRWVKLRMPAEIGCEVLQQIMTMPGTAQEVFNAQKAAPRSCAVSGLDIEKTKQRYNLPGWFTVRNLRNRNAAITYVLTHPGLYIYDVTGETAGHAFAFDSRQAGLLLFFDANNGSWEFRDESDATISASWRDFCEGTADNTRVDYKTLMTKGLRELSRYQVAA